MATATRTRKTAATVATTDDTTSYSHPDATADGFVSDGTVSLARPYTGTLESEARLGRALLNTAELADVSSEVVRHESDGELMTDRAGRPIMVPNGTALFAARRLDAMVAAI